MIDPGDRFRRPDGVVELRLVEARFGRSLLVLAAALVVALIVGIVTADGGRVALAVALVVAVVAIGAFWWGHRRRAILIDGGRIGWCSGWRRSGKWWIDTADVTTVLRDSFLPAEGVRYVSYVVVARRGGMPLREVSSIGRLSVAGRAAVRDQIATGGHPFVVPVSDLGAERAAVIDALLAPTSDRGGSPRWS